MIGPDKDNSINKILELIDRYKLNDNIVIKGKLTKEEWSILSEEYDIFINTTNYDNQPVTLLEAMALGLPIVSTNVGGIPNLIDDDETGLLVNPNDIVSMSEKILSLVDRKISGEKITSNALRKISEYDVSIILPKWMDLIDSIIHE